MKNILSFCGGMVVGIFVTVGFAVIVKSHQNIKLSHEITTVVIKFTGLLIAMFTAKPFVMRVLTMTSVTTPRLGGIEFGVSRMIGYIERFLAYGFVLDGSDNAISMLITAKGIYRIHELGFFESIKSDQTENLRDKADKENKVYYVMIGTFTSISYSIIIGYIVKYITYLINLPSA